MSCHGQHSLLVYFYRVTYPPNVDYTHLTPLEEEKDDFHLTLRDKLAVVKTKKRCASRGNAWAQLVFLLCTFLFGACNARQDTVVVEGLTLDVNRQQVGERIWAAVSLVPLHELPMEPDVDLLRPQTIRLDANGSVFVMDWGDMTVKRFNADGEYMTTYGSGVGSAPGELTSLFDMGALGDTIVYVLDKSAGRISLFASGGALVETIPVPATYHRHVVTAAGRSYSMSRGAANFVTSLGSDKKGFGNTLLESQRGESLYAARWLHHDLWREHGLSPAVIPGHYTVRRKWRIRVCQDNPRFRVCTSSGDYLASARIYGTGCGITTGISRCRWRQDKRVFACGYFRHRCLRRANGRLPVFDCRTFGIVPHEAGPRVSSPRHHDSCLCCRMVTQIIS